MKPEDKGWLAPAELAARRSKSIGTITRWRGIGKGPRYENDGRIRYPMADVLEWEASLVRSNTAQTKPFNFASRLLPGAKTKR